MADLSSVPATVAGATPEALRSHLKSELELWATVIKQAGVVPEQARVEARMGSPAVRAMVLDRPGTNLVMHERPLPSPGPGEILIEIEACGV